MSNIWADILCSLSSNLKLKRLIKSHIGRPDCSRDVNHGYVGENMTQHTCLFTRTKKKICKRNLKLVAWAQKNPFKLENKWITGDLNDYGITARLEFPFSKWLTHRSHWRLLLISIEIIWSKFVKITRMTIKSPDSMWYSFVIFDYFYSYSMITTSPDQAIQAGCSLKAHILSPTCTKRCVKLCKVV